jgi:hypothetical protein
MKLPIEFFALNLRFARRISEVSDKDLATALLQYTHLFVRFVDRSFDPQHPLWQAYTAGLGQADDAVAWTYHFYNGQIAPTDTLEITPFSCFYYSVWSDNRIRLHFHNGEQAPHHPLSRERMPLRLAELRQMFTEIREKVPQATNVVGGSWLYNLEAYRRLFPPEFSNSAHVGNDDVNFMAQWGQFLASNGGMRVDTTQAFLDCLSQKQSVDELLRCFPFSVLRLECEIGAFYQFYGIDAPIEPA